MYMRCVVDLILHCRSLAAVRRRADVNRLESRRNTMLQHSTKRRGCRRTSSSTAAYALLLAPLKLNAEVRRFALDRTPPLTGTASTHHSYTPMRIQYFIFFLKRHSFHCATLRSVARKTHEHGEGMTACARTARPREESILSRDDQRGFREVMIESMYIECYSRTSVECVIYIAHAACVRPSSSAASRVGAAPSARRPLRASLRTALEGRSDQQIQRAHAHTVCDIQPSDRDACDYRGSIATSAAESPHSRAPRGRTTSGARDRRRPGRPTAVACCTSFSGASSRVADMPSCACVRMCVEGAIHEPLEAIGGRLTAACEVDSAAPR
jgi:hypothetical protein